jgi:hypothetical protein
MEFRLPPYCTGLLWILSRHLSVCPTLVLLLIPFSEPCSRPLLHGHSSSLSDPTHMPFTLSLKTSTPLVQRTRRHFVPSTPRCCAAQRVRIRGLSPRPIPAGVVAGFTSTSGRDDFNIGRRLPFRESTCDAFVTPKSHVDS